MELPDFIRLGNQEPPLRFLVIGGWAVGAHGHTRPTFDVDFCVRRADREAWLTKAESVGLKLYRESHSFAQFTEPAGGDGFDLMYANEATFDGLWKDSVPTDFNGAARACKTKWLLANAIRRCHESVRRESRLISVCAAVLAPAACADRMRNNASVASTAGAAFVTTGRVG